MIRTKKLFLFLLGIVVVGFIFGLLFMSILSTNNKDLVKECIINYFSVIQNKKINYVNNMINEVSSNLGINILVWLIGISIIGIIVVSGILLFKAFLMGFSFFSIIYTFGFKGCLLAIIYIIPEIISLCIMFILVYYAISFSILLFNYLFRKKEMIRTLIVRRYLKVLGFVCVGTFITSLLKVFVIPNLLRLF